MSTWANSACHGVRGQGDLLGLVISTDLARHVTLVYRPQVADQGAVGATAPGFRPMPWLSPGTQGLCQLAMVSNTTLCVNVRIGTLIESVLEDEVGRGIILVYRPEEGEADLLIPRDVVSDGDIPRHLAAHTTLAQTI